MEGASATAADGAVGTDPAQTPAGSKLSRGDVTRSLRAFTVFQGLWGAWGQLAGLGTAVMTGYALWLGADASSVALLTSIISVMALAQLLAPVIGSRFQDEKRFILIARRIAILLRGSILAIPFVIPEGWRFPALVCLLGASLMLIHVASPFMGSWQAHVIPRAIRARFTSKATIIGTLAAMVTGFVVGAFLDAFDDSSKQIGFTSIFAASMLLGWICTRALAAAAYPGVAQPSGAQFRPQMLLEPLRNPNFRKAVLFYGSSQFALGLAAPFYSVYMLENLKLSYTTISIFTAVSMLASIAGYRSWAGLIDRFGSKPVLQLLLAPYALVPLLWVFTDAEGYLLIPVALIFGGFVGAGVGAGITPLVFDLLPEGSKKPIYLAVWSASVSVIFAAGPLLGSFMGRSLAGLEFHLLSTTVGPLHVIFFASAVAGLVPLVLLGTVRDSSTISSRSLLKRMSRGNLLRYIYNAALYRLSTSERRRARAALAMGKSHSPLAVQELARAMRDASSEVRRRAAHGLGESRSRDAAEHLIGELKDRSSDIRGEAAEALGRLGLADGVESLIESLDDDDLRIRISAIRALAEIKGEEVQELLFWHLTNGFEPLTFPTLVDVLGAMGDRRVVLLALRQIGQFRSVAIRLQLLNAVCNALGAGGQFYKLVAYDEQRRSAAIKRVLSRAGESLAGASFIRPAAAGDLAQLFRRAGQQFDEEDTTALAASIIRIAALLKTEVTAHGTSAIARTDFHAVIQALDEFLNSDGAAGMLREQPVAVEILLAVCLQRLSAAAPDLESNRER